ncbi:hypothetical protein D3C84_1135920 [compost metagenome]
MQHQKAKAIVGAISAAFAAADGAGVAADMGDLRATQVTPLDFADEQGLAMGIARGEPTADLLDVEVPVV